MMDNLEYALITAHTPQALTTYVSDALKSKEYVLYGNPFYSENAFHQAVIKIEESK